MLAVKLNVLAYYEYRILNALRLITWCCKFHFQYILVFQTDQTVIFVHIRSGQKRKEEEKPVAFITKTMLCTKGTQIVNHNKIEAKS